VAIEEEGRRVNGEKGEENEGGGRRVTGEWSVRGEEERSAGEESKVEGGRVARRVARRGWGRRKEGEGGEEVRWEERGKE